MDNSSVNSDININLYVSAVSNTEISIYLLNAVLSSSSSLSLLVFFGSSVGVP